MYCPFCGSKNTDQLTKLIVIIQLPGAAIDAAAFFCGNCKKRWFVEGREGVGICPKCGAPFSSLVFCKCTEDKSGG